MSNNVLRQRDTKPSSPTPALPTNTPAERPLPPSTRSLTLLDVLRILSTLALTALALSYYLTAGSSLFFNYPRPWFTRPALLKSYLSGPLLVTPTQLLKYDGTDPSLPIYLAINGTVFDVSRHTYGPGGSYNFFAGRDATRAFVTGCFAEDRTGDLRGVEEMYIPVEDDPGEQISSGERKKRAERERRAAKRMVRDEVRKWESFYQKSEKYFEVGKVVSGDKGIGDVPPELCEDAKKMRPRRSTMEKEKEKGRRKDEGKPVQ
jgi:predicted heme/steroid binding protein